jgi:hypothetical protein
MSTMTQPAALWMDANREEIDSENRMAEADARDEYERNELRYQMATNAADSLRGALAPWAYEATRADLLAYWRSGIAKATGETPPTGYEELIAWCDAIARAEESLTDRELMEWVA